MADVKKSAKSAEEMTLDNFVIPEAPAGVDMPSIVGLYSAEHSETKDGKKVPVLGWSRGKKPILTRFDIERATNEGKEPDEATPSMYGIVELTHHTIVAERGVAKIAKPGEYILLPLTEDLASLEGKFDDAKYEYQLYILPNPKKKITGNGRKYQEYSKKFTNVREKTDAGLDAIEQLKTALALANGKDAAKQISQASA